MDLSLPSSTETSRPGTPTETNCERLISIKNDIEKFSIVVENTKAGLKTLLFAGIPENDPTILDHNRRLEEYQRLQQLAVSEFTSQPFCNTPGCTIHHTPSCSPVKTFHNSNSKTTATKRKDNEEGYVSPSNRQIAKNRRTTPATERNFKLDLKNKFEQLRLEQTGPASTGTDPAHSKNPTENTPKSNSDTPSNGNKKLLPPPVFLEISNEYREQIKVLNKKFPALRSKMTGEYFKLYTDTDEQYYNLQDFLETTDYRFFSITPKKDRPIKVVIKGLPRDTDTSDIHKDLIEEGFTIIKVTQLVGKITKQKLPVFLISLPRNIHNAKIFDLKKLSFVSVNVEGYDGKGVTQCYSCQKFNHTADNCRLTPRCLKCGENHQTRECLIQKVEQAFCINCQTFGHMANYAKCPLFPKPKKTALSTNKNDYTSIVNSLVRPNISYAQATHNNTNNSNPQQQMAPPVKAAPVNKSQTQASRETPATQINNSNQNSNAALITQTLQGIIQALTTLTVQIGNMNFNNNPPQSNKTKKSKQTKKRELCALIEAIYDEDDE
ncbi:nucleic-acid-binding protein from transposon X-element [Trichonephila clavipes]|nr:nucleic-acid-binding protein from transposon X-element [Trichonephila clavipes]